jgi:hypothetical protein
MQLMRLQRKNQEVVDSLSAQCSPIFRLQPDTLRGRRRTLRASRLISVTFDLLPPVKGLCVELLTAI